MTPGRRRRAELYARTRITASRSLTRPVGAVAPPSTTGGADERLAGRLLHAGR
jgi:hypothetical protein